MTPQKDGSERGRPLIRWTLGILTVTVLLSIGSPLIGLRAFFPGDLLHQADPWNQTGSTGLRVTNPILEDVVNANMPKVAEYRRRIGRGDYPLWTQSPTGGVPFGTQPTAGTFAPLDLPYLILPLWYAPAVAKLLEMALAAAFTFAFLKRIGLGTLASLVGGLVYVNSGFQAVWTNWPHGHIGALIPGLFWAGERLVQRRDVGAVVPVVAIAAAMLFEGYPPLAAYGVIAAGTYVAARLAFGGHDSRARRRFRELGLFGAGLALAVGVAALQILPFLSRLGELDLGYREQGAGAHLPLRALVTLAFPNAFGSPAGGGYYFGALHYRQTNYVVLNYQEVQSFVGAAALVLVLVAATRVRRGGRTSTRLVPNVWAYMCIGSALLALLIYVGGPPLAAVQAIPLFHLAFIGRMRAVLGFFLAVLAAIGMQALADRERGRAWSRRLAVAAAAVSAAVAILGVRTVYDLAREAHQRVPVARSAILPLVAAAVAVAVAGVGPWQGLGRRLKVAGHPAGLWAMPILISVESLAFVLPLWPRVPKALFYPTTPAHLFLQQHVGADRLASGGTALYPGTSAFYGLRSLNAHTFEDPAWRQLMKDADPRVLPPERPTWALFATGEAVVRSPVLDRLSVRYFVNPIGAPIVGRRTDPSPPAGEVVLRPGSPQTATTPQGPIRGVAVRVVRGLPGSQDAVLRAEILDPSGRVLSRGARRIRADDAAGLFEIPVVEIEGAAPAGSAWTVRVSLEGKGQLVLAADPAGRPSLSVVLGGSDGLKLVFATGVAIYERMHVLPRIRWAGRTRVVADPAERLRALATGVAPDTVILNQEGPPGSAGGARLRVLEDGGDQVRVQVEAVGAGYLVVADAMQDGWIASLDGRPAALRPADHGLVAVHVPRGRHQVTLRYDPGGWDLGQPISVASTVLLLVMALAGGPARRLTGRG